MKIKTLGNNQWVKFTREKLHYFDMNDKGKYVFKTYQMQLKQYSKENLQLSNAFIKKERPQVNNQNFHLKTRAKRAN